MRRRTFLLGSLAVAGMSACSAGGGGANADSTTTTPQDQRKYGRTVLNRSAPSPDAPNVLFISIDDCNDWLGFLNNHPGTQTPNLDALAAESLVFQHAYTTAPMCLPARTGVMFGQPSVETHVYDHSPPSRDAYKTLQGSTASVVDAFWGAGYATYGTGKIFHEEHANRWDQSFRQAWYVPANDRDEPAHRADERFETGWISPYDGQPIGEGQRFTRGQIDFGPSGRRPEDEPDGQATAWVIDRLRDEQHAPFFLGHGIYLPHEPWRLPQEFFDLHPLDEVVVPEFRPDDLDDLGPYARDELIDASGTFEAVYTSGVWQQAVQAYQAALSYADWCVGQVLDELYSGPHADDTIVAVWSDHGFHLGEKMHMLKFTLWERATRVPLVLHVPGRFDQGQTFEPPVSLLDLGPTIQDLAGVEPLETFAGASLLPMVDDPALADERPPVTTWLFGNHAVRRGPWRYIRYNTGETELYDVDRDPDEYTNLAARPEHAALMAELDGLLPPSGEG